MMIVRIIALILIIVSAIAYFYAREYAIYPAIAGFALIVFINLPLNIWLAIQREKIKKGQLKNFESEDKKTKAGTSGNDNSGS